VSDWYAGYMTGLGIALIGGTLAERYGRRLRFAVEHALRRLFRRPEPEPPSLGDPYRSPPPCCPTCGRPNVL